MTDFDEDYDGDRQDDLTLTDSKGLILADYVTATSFYVNVSYHSDLNHDSGMSCEKDLKDLIGMGYLNDLLETLTVNDLNDFNGFVNDSELMAQLLVREGPRDHRYLRGGL